MKVQLTFTDHKKQPLEVSLLALPNVGDNMQILNSAHDGKKYTVKSVLHTVIPNGDDAAAIIRITLEN